MEKISKFYQSLKTVMGQPSRELISDKLSQIWLSKQTNLERSSFIPEYESKYPYPTQVFKQIGGESMAGISQRYNSYARATAWCNGMDDPVLDAYLKTLICEAGDCRVSYSEVCKSIANLRSEDKSGRTGVCPGCGRRTENYFWLLWHSAAISMLYPTLLDVPAYSVNSLNDAVHHLLTGLFRVEDWSFIRSYSPSGSTVENKFFVDENKASRSVWDCDSIPEFARQRFGFLNDFVPLTIESPSVSIIDEVSVECAFEEVDEIPSDMPGLEHLSSVESVCQATEVASSMCHALQVLADSAQIVLPSHMLPSLENYNKFMNDPVTDFVTSKCRGTPRGDQLAMYAHCIRNLELSGAVTVDTSEITCGSRESNRLCDWFCDLAEMNPAAAKAVVSSFVARGNIAATTIVKSALNRQLTSHQESLAICLGLATFERDAICNKLKVRKAVLNLLHNQKLSTQDICIISTHYSGSLSSFPTPSRISVVDVNGFRAVLASTWNKLMHTLNGNIDANTYVASCVQHFGINRMRVDGLCTTLANLALMPRPSYSLSCLTPQVCERWPEPPDRQLQMTASAVSGFTSTVGIDAIAASAFNSNLKGLGDRQFVEKLSRILRILSGSRFSWSASRACYEYIRMLLLNDAHTYIPPLALTPIFVVDPPRLVSITGRSCPFRIRTIICSPEQYIDLLEGTASDHLGQPIVVDYCRCLALAAKDIASNARVVVAVFNSNIRHDYLTYSWTLGQGSLTNALPEFFGLEGLNRPLQRALSFYLAAPFDQARHHELSMYLIDFGFRVSHFQLGAAPTVSYVTALLGHISANTLPHNATYDVLCVTDTPNRGPINAEQIFVMQHEADEFIGQLPSDAACVALFGCSKFEIDGECGLFYSRHCLARLSLYCSPDATTVFGGYNIGDNVARVTPTNDMGLSYNYLVSMQYIERRDHYISDLDGRSVGIDPPLRSIGYPGLVLEIEKLANVLCDTFDTWQYNPEEPLVDSPVQFGSIGDAKPTVGSVCAVVSSLLGSTVGALLVQDGVTDTGKRYWGIWAGDANIDAVEACGKCTSFQLPDANIYSLGCARDALINITELSGLKSRMRFGRALAQFAVGQVDPQGGQLTREEVFYVFSVPVCDSRFVYSWRDVAITPRNLNMRQFSMRPFFQDATQRSNMLSPSCPRYYYCKTVVPSVKRFDRCMPSEEYQAFVGGDFTPSGAPGADSSAIKATIPTPVEAKIKVATEVAEIPKGLADASVVGSVSAPAEEVPLPGTPAGTAASVPGATGTTEVKVESKTPEATPAATVVAPPAPAVAAAEEEKKKKVVTA
nr:TPA_asm: hypothetical protein [Triaenono virus 1]